VVVAGRRLAWGLADEVGGVGPRHGRGRLHGGWSTAAGVPPALLSSVVVTILASTGCRSEGP
jgi:hypothetical protein